MIINRRHLVAIAAALFAAGLSAPVHAAGSVVHVSLWDTGPNAMDKLGNEPPIAIGYPGAQTPAKDRTMGITATPDTVPAGEVTFEVVNDSKETVHEMIVAPIKTINKPLPYSKQDMRVEEEKAGHLGEVSELNPGASGALRLNMKPGTYILYCNIPGHYVLGMWTLFHVGSPGSGATANK